MLQLKCGHKSNFATTKRQLKGKIVEELVMVTLALYLHGVISNGG